MMEVAKLITKSIQYTQNITLRNEKVHARETQNFKFHPGHISFHFIFKMYFDTEILWYR